MSLQLVQQDDDDREMIPRYTAADLKAGAQPSAEVTPAEPVVPADDPTVRAYGPPRKELLPILPPWLESRDSLRTALRWWVGYIWHVLAYHVTRIPQYSGRVVARSPRGFYRAFGAYRRWLIDSETRGLQQDAARRNDVKAHTVLTRQRRNRSGYRWMLSAGIVVAVLTLIPIARATAPDPTLPLLAVCVLLILARIDSRVSGTPIVGHAVNTLGAPKLTTNMVVDALAALGISKIDSAVKEGNHRWFPSPIQREGTGESGGWRADVDLPPGVVPADVMDKRDRLASALRRPISCVWPEPNPRIHEGRLVLYVGDKDMSEIIVPWKLAQVGSTDVFKTFHFGNDPRGRAVKISMMYQNYLIGAIMRQGKTASARVITAGCALDPIAELWIHELKGTGDLEAFERVAYRYVSGLDDESVMYALESARLLRVEVEARVARLARVPAELRPDKKVNRKIAEHRAWKLHPIVAIFDECQNLFLHPQYGKEAAELAQFIMRIGPAVAVSCVWITQRPDRDALPTGISTLASMRFALKVNDHISNDMILGTGAHKIGLRATEFRNEVDAGTGLLVGLREPTVVRTAYLDGPAAERIADRALALRTAAGTLAGHAVGEEAERSEDAFTVLVDVLKVWTPGEEALWSDVLAERLGTLSGRYAGWSAIDVGNAVRRLGVSVGNIHRKIDGTGVTRKGIKVRDVLRSLERAGGDAPELGSAEPLPIAASPAIDSRPASPSGPR